jgi:transposase
MERTSSPAGAVRKPALAAQISDLIRDLVNARRIGHRRQGSNTPLAPRGASMRRSRIAARDQPCRHRRPEQDLSQGKRRRSPRPNRPSGPGLQSCHPFPAAQSGPGRRRKHRRPKHPGVCPSSGGIFETNVIPFEARADIFVLGQLIRHSSCDYVPADHWRSSSSLCPEHLDLCEIVASYKSGLGQLPFDPRMMTALLLYAYCSGLHSSRRIAKACAERVYFMMTVAHDAPDFRTIADFGKRRLPPLGRLFLQVLELAEKPGWRSCACRARGTKIKANVSKHKAMSYERMKTRETELRAKVDRWLEAAEATDAQEDKLHGASRCGDEMPGRIADNRSAWPKSSGPERRLRRRPQVPRRRKRSRMHSGGEMQGREPQALGASFSPALKRA